MQEISGNFNSDDLSIAKQLIKFVIGEQTFFSPVRNQFSQYWRLLQQTKDERLTAKINDFSGETLTKLWQLDYLLAGIKSLDENAELFRQQNINTTPVHIQWQENLKASNDDYGKFPVTQEIIDSLTNNESYLLLIKIELFTESFYYIAHRLKKIFEYYPGLEKFQAPGVTNVRNNLIDHPHGKHGITSPSFAIGGVNGPVVKAGRRENEKDVSVDSGLYKNAIEFRDNLAALLESALQHLHKK